VFSFNYNFISSHYASSSSFFFFLLTPLPPEYTLFPYTTLFRSPMTSRIERKFLIENEPKLGDISQYTFPEDANPNVLSIDQSTSLDRKSTRLNSSHANISYAVFCLKKKKQTKKPPSIAAPSIIDRNICTAISNQSRTYAKAHR